jgi:hypothetical protein
MPTLRKFARAAVAFAVIGVSLLASAAFADVTPRALIITATNAAGDAATFEIPAPPAVEFWTWTSHERIEMLSPTTGDLIAVINPDGEESSVTYISDPSITVAFAVQAGAGVTLFTISSGLLSFAPFNAEGRATVGMSVSDTDGDGATLTGDGPTGGAYLAEYNGLAPAGTTFAEVIASITAASYSSNTASSDTPALGFSPMGIVADMSVEFRFVLSPFDQASGTSTYVTRDFPLATENVSWGKIKSLYK